MYLIYLIKNTLYYLRTKGFIFIIKESYKYIKKTLYIPYLLYFSNDYKKVDNLDDLIEQSFNKFGGLLKPIQVKHELINFLKLVKNNEPKYILEIGTANGGTLFLFSKISNDNAEIISIDMPGGGFGGGYPLWKIPFYNSFASNNQKIHLLRLNSHDQSTLENVKNIIGDRKIDLLFIDGDHSYDGVKSDFDMYKSLMRNNGIIAFHDIVDHGNNSDRKVNIFWEELKLKYKHLEIVENWNQRWGGIGIIYYN